MRRAKWPRQRRETGAAAVEFGLISILLLALIIYVMQFAIWFWAYQVGAHAAREGARVGAVNPCDTLAIRDTAALRVGSASNATPSVNVTRSATPLKVGDEVTVEVTFSTHTIAAGFLPFPLPSIDKTATARVENVPAGGGC